MNNFKYLCTTVRGFVKVPVSLRKLYKMGLAYRGNPLFIKADVYADAKNCEIEYRTNLFGKTIITLLIPIIFITEGWNRFTLEEIKRELFQTKYDIFSVDEFSEFSERDEIGSKLCAIAADIINSKK